MGARRAPAMSPDWKAALGWGPDFEAAMRPHLAKALEPARVILVYRKQLKVLSHRGEHWARSGGKMVYRAESMDELPAVGDWVAARIPDAGEALVHAVLPRRSAFVRKVPGDNASAQVLASNVDTVLVVMGLDQDFNLRRLERFLTLAFESGAQPVVVLNKRDVAPDVPEKLALAAGISRAAPLYAVSALAGQGLEPLAPLFGWGKTVALLGSSGVGKSTLVNHLSGAEVMKTGEVRDDGRGRHTTTRRELLVLPTGGAVIDTPGLREVQMWAAKDGLALSFDDIEALAETCRFRDCQHDAEPGCAVKAALKDGTLAQARYDSWEELGREMAWLRRPPGSRGRPESKRRERVGHGVRKK
jgi:ribosome biogenesis GTPase / thiamine phosphate phosphatase